MNTTQYVPFISAIIVTRNEQDYILKCFSSLIYQDYPREKFEIIVVDGQSSDDTMRIIREAESEFRRTEKSVYPTVSFYTNEKRILASGWNIGVKQAKGEFTVRIDGHAYADKSFLAKSVETMLRVGDAVCVGGSMRTITDTKQGEIIIKALSSPFGVGGSKFRYIKKPGYVDTVAYGLYKKSVFEDVGYFDERLTRTQDNDLHRRIRDTGGKFYLDPSIVTYYFSRSSVKKLLKQQFQNGLWTMINFILRPGKMSIRHFIPFLFAVFLLVSAVCGCIWHRVWWVSAFVIVLHFFCGTVFAAKRAHRISEILMLPGIFFLMHLFYGAGSFYGIFMVHRIKKI